MKEYENIWRGLFGKSYNVVRTSEPTSRDDNRSKNCQDRQSALSFALLGIGACISAVFILIVNPYNILYEWKITFGPGGEIFSIWEKPPVDLFLKVYLWNVTNSEEFMSGKASKLKFEEVGPYTYRELLEHANVTFNDNGTLTSIPNHPLVWDPVLSEGHQEDDVLILPNIALLSIADVVSKKSMFTRFGLNVIIRQTNSQPLVKMTAKEFMFGYRSALMNLGNTFMPSWIYFDKLGLIDRMYEFRGDFETYFDGTKHGLKNIGQIDKYNGLSKMPQWDSPCGDISGASDATKFPGYLNESDRLMFFRKSLCRPKELMFINETYLDGFKAYRYEFTPNQDDNGRVHARNRCFCKQEDVNKCLPTGLLDVQSCYYGFPIALSYPHFLDTDPIAFEKTESGLNPDPFKHRSYLILEPRSGMPLKVAIRYQINMALGNLKNIANSELFSNMYLPMLWMEIGMYKLPSSLRLRFKFYLDIIPIVQTCLMYALFILSPLTLFYAIYKFVNSRKPNQTWIEDDFVRNIDRKLSSYMPDKKDGFTAKELEVYFSSLLAAPITRSANNIIGCEEA